jgi:hypothetical protein
VRYLKTTTITEDEWAEYCKAVDEVRPEKWFCDFAEEHLDRMDHIVDSDGFEDVEVVLLPEK